MNYSYVPNHKKILESPMPSSCNYSHRKGMTAEISHWDPRGSLQGGEYRGRIMRTCFILPPRLPLPSQAALKTTEQYPLTLQVSFKLHHAQQPTKADKITILHKIDASKKTPSPPAIFFSLRGKPKRKRSEIKKRFEREIFLQLCKETMLYDSEVA